MKRIHCALVLDKSGSMASTKDQTISGFNEQIEQIKINAKDAPFETTITLVTFNGAVFEHLFMAPADQIEKADPKYYIPDGSTAMFDGMGYTINKLKEHMAPEDDIMMITITDGDNNSSVHYTPEALNETIDSLKATGHWTFTMIGCDERSLKKVSASTGIPLNNMAVWDNVKGGNARHGMRKSAHAMGNYLRAKASAPDMALVDKFYTESANCANFVDNQTAVSNQVLGFCDDMSNATQSNTVEELNVGTSDIFAKGNAANFK